MSITHITSTLHLSKVLKPEKLTVIDFHATWCGPCHAIAPTFETLSKQYTDVNFCKCDVDASADVAKQYGVSAMPTFVFLRGTTKVDEIRGANPGGLKAAVERHSKGSSGGSFSGQGNRLGGEGSADLTGAASNAFNGLNPQMRLAVSLIAAYLVLWYLSK